MLSPNWAKINIPISEVQSHMFCGIPKNGVGIKHHPQKFLCQQGDQEHRMAVNWGIYQSKEL
jgi:hypothetical protein